MRKISATAFIFICIVVLQGCLFSSREKGWIYLGDKKVVQVKSEVESESCKKAVKILLDDFQKAADEFYKESKQVRDDLGSEMSDTTKQALHGSGLSVERIAGLAHLQFESMLRSAVDRGLQKAGCKNQNARSTDTFSSDLNTKADLSSGSSSKSQLSIKIPAVKIASQKKVLNVEIEIALAEMLPHGVDANDIATLVGSDLASYLKHRLGESQSGIEKSDDIKELIKARVSESAFEAKSVKFTKFFVSDAD
jgi:hypothetical protein